MTSWKFYLNNIEVDEPIGWDGIEFMAKRTESHGLDQPFSTEVAFYGKAANILKQSFDSYFINAEISIKIISNVFVNGVAWEFDGHINMDVYSEKNSCDSDTFEVSVGIVEDNFREKFKARMGVDVDFYADKDLNGLPISTANFDDIRLHTQQVYLVGYGKNYSPTNPNSTYIYYQYSHGWILEDFALILPAYFNNTDFKGAFGSTFDPQSIRWTPSDGVCFKNNSTFQRKIKFNIDINGSFGWNPNSDAQIGNSANLVLSLQVTNGNLPNGGSETQRYYLGTTAVNTFQNPLYSTQFDFNVEQEILLNPNDRVLIFMQWGGDGNIAVGQFNQPGIYEMRIYIENCCVTITENNEASYASNVEGMLVENAFRRLVEIMTGDSDGFISDTFSKENDGCYWNYLITNGLKIRNAKTLLNTIIGCGTEDATSKYKISFNKLFDGLNKIFCLGWDFEFVDNKWKVRVESLEYFYQNVIATTFENAKEVTQNAMTQDLINQVKVGYSDKWKNIQIAGLWAIHTDRNYYINNRALSEGTTKDLDLLSDIIAEGYAIEFSRRLQFFQDDSGSSDRPNDYETFIIWVNKYELTIENVQSTCFKVPDEIGTKIFSPGSVSVPSNLIFYSSSQVQNLYNINITPARNAARLWKYLGMFTYGIPTFASPELVFVSGEYQIDYYSQILETEINPVENSGCVILVNGEINEGANIGASIFEAEENKKYLFKPIEIEFEYPQSLCDFINLSSNNQFCKVRVSIGSMVKSGWIQSMDNKPNDAKGGTTRFKLIASNIADPEPPIPPGGRAYSDAYSNAYQ